MAQKKTAPALPPVTVARLQAATTQIDGLVDKNVDVFAARAGRYVDTFRERSERDMAPDEVAQIAGALGAALGREDIPELLAEVQGGNLRVRSDPPRIEALLAAGLATAPAFVDACLEFVALIEMSADEFEQANENRQLELAIVEPVRELRRLGLRDAKTRVRAAFEHLASEAETTPGEALGLIAKVLGTALSEAIGPLSQYASLTGSLARMGGPDESASTDSPGGT